ncbi:MAG TPA: hypothetical protein VG818_03210 [Gemmatimonadaceae bacterium]|nr:hypothetical protein [Gemmatimonadaceae bacterium]
MTDPEDEGAPPPPAPTPAPVVLPEADNTSSQLDRARMLAEVMDYVIKVSTPTPMEIPRPKLWVPLLGFACMIFAFYSWGARPEWIWGPQPDAAQAQATRDAEMRFQMFLLAQRIFNYRREFGAVPDSLAQVGERIPGVRYEALTDTSFVLRYERGIPIILYSTDSMDDFLRNALDVVTAGKPK